MTELLMSWMLPAPLQLMVPALFRTEPLFRVLVVVPLRFNTLPGATLRMPAESTPPVQEEGREAPPLIVSNPGPLKVPPVRLKALLTCPGPKSVNDPPDKVRAPSLTNSPTTWLPPEM